ncbi:hypothetical protein [Pseudobacteroides cellulosolvens]|uniref:Uncharacterized protein n=1 Tax=Pseudobacteroides cellulosolvens ATCC 35603 = DSM 2933 TaxID=398512 RepID=A0A0L6JRB1_9FIRM|nr:hypothetical protein [Pseudobacteroides cellulosolvens]KNY28319.1 hypothetical protein Bccel_3593 [Pseudobacteroides cellulosolvens ATCC 35603 = DSM 2933]
MAKRKNSMSEGKKEYYCIITALLQEYDIQSASFISQIFASLSQISLRSSSVSVRNGSHKFSHTVFSIVLTCNNPIPHNNLPQSTFLTNYIPLI